MTGPQSPQPGPPPADDAGPASGTPQPPPGWGQPAAPPTAWGPPPGWGQPGNQPGQLGPHPGGPVQSDDTTWALLAHLSVFVLALIGPLVIYLVKKDGSPFVRQHAAEALNFHITVLIASIVSAVLMLVLIGFLLLAVVVIGSMVLGIVAAVAAGRGQPYRYPLTLRLVS